MNTHTVELSFQPALKRKDLLSPSIQTLINNLDPSIQAKILVAEIDPSFAGGNDLCNYYNIPFESGANCVIVNATRAQTTKTAACVYPVSSRVDMNKVVRKKLDVRRVSLAPVEDVIAKTQMEYGSITPIGLPGEWPVLIDSRILLQETIIIGSGMLNGKLRLPPKILVEVSNAEIVENLAKLNSDE